MQIYVNKSRITIIFLIVILVCACTPGSDPEHDAAIGEDWPAGLAAPIDGATFSLAENHLPGAPRHYREGIHQGFDFFNGMSGVPLADEQPVVAVAGGEVVRIDHDYADQDPAVLEFWSRETAAPGFLGAYALDRLRGRQIWLRHPDGHVSRYAHLAMVHPELHPGDTVEQGQAIGLMGNSGVPPTEAQPEPAPHLHFELWSPDGEHYLGQGLDALQTHQRVAALFGEQALPRYARRVVAAVNAGEAAPEVYPPAELPETGFNVEPPASAVAGEVFAVPITWEGDDFEPSDFFAFLEDQPLGIINAGDGAWILGAIPIDDTPEQLQLSIGAADAYGQTLIGGRAIERIARAAAPQPLEVDADAIARYSDEDLEHEARQLGPVMFDALQLREALWQQPFQPPTDGEVVRHFGQRIFHGMLRPVQPLPGITVRAPADAPVLATNAGIVAMVEDLPLRGRTVAVIHGGGAVSLYSHLEGTQVLPGEEVIAGQQLGTVGQSGTADSPQLRWEMRLAGVATNPLGWLDRMVPGRAGD